MVTALAGTAKKAANAESVPATQTSVSLTGLKGGTAYAFRVQALNAYGGGASAATAASVTPTGGTSTYASTVLSGWGLGYVVQHYGWDAGFAGLTACAVIGTVLFIAVWRAKANGYGDSGGKSLNGPVGK